MTRVGRAVEKGETQGFMKVVVDRDTDAILGAAILGRRRRRGDPRRDRGDGRRRHGSAYTRATPIHPTVSELVPTVFGELSP